MKVSEILARAADHIERYGWTRGEFLDDTPPGDDTTDQSAPYRPLPPKECAVCARGGIAVAVGRHPMFTEEPLEHYEHDLLWPEDLNDEPSLAEPDRQALEAIRAAEAVFARHLRERAGCTITTSGVQNLIARWNDEDDRTAEQVIAELRACAAIEREAGR